MPRIERKRVREAELAILQAVLLDEQSHYRSYVESIRRKLRMNEGQVSLALRKLSALGHLYTYGSERKGRGARKLYRPTDLGVVRAIAEVESPTLRQVERWLFSAAYQTTEVFTCFLPDDLVHLRKVCKLALKLIEATRKPYRNVLKAVLVSTVIYFLQNPDLVEPRKRVAAKYPWLGKRFEDWYFRQFFMIDSEKLRLEKEREASAKAMTEANPAASNP